MNTLENMSIYSYCKALQDFAKKTLPKSISECTTKQLQDDYLKLKILENQDIIRDLGRKDYHNIKSFNPIHTEMKYKLKSACDEDTEEMDTVFKFGEICLRMDNLLMSYYLIDKPDTSNIRFLIKSAQNIWVSGGNCVSCSAIYNSFDFMVRIHI